MGFRGVLKFFLRSALEIFIIVALLVLIPNLPPHANFSKPFSVTPPKPFAGKLSLNNRLDSVEVWHKGDFLGPESFADFNGELYTSLYSGDIVKLNGEQHIAPVIKFGKPCRGSYEESICGRPLGIEFDNKGYLYASDAYYGIFKVDIKTGHKEQLISPETKVVGVPAKTFNSLVIAGNGDVYWTDSTSDFGLEDGLLSFFADGSGRLIHYDAKTKKNRVLIDELHFANGVALSDDEEFVVVAETARSRLHRYYLKGPKKGKREVFLDGLPGLPDNLKSDGKGGFLVPLILGRDADHPMLIQSIGPFPLLRKAVARLLGVAQYVFKKFSELVPNEITLRVAHYIGHFTSVPKGLSPTRVTLLRVNRNGEITDSVHNLNGKIASISEMHVFRDTLYLGSPFNDYIARIPLAKVGWEDLRKDERAKRAAPTETTKPITTTTPKPTTTTPKPTTTTTTTPRPTTTTPKPATTTTPKPSTTTPKSTTTTAKPTTTTAKVTTSQKPATTTPQQAKPTNPPPVKQQAPPPVKQEAAPKQAPSQGQQQQQKQAPPPPAKQQPKPAQGGQK